MTTSQASTPDSTAPQADDGKHGGEPSDKPWVPDPQPAPSPDGTRPEQYAPQP